MNKDGDRGYIKMAASDIQYTCDDFLEFQDTLKRMRSIDDKIIYALNTSIPTSSFRSQVDAASECKHLYDQLQDAYEQRENAIKRCISEVSDKVKLLKDRRSRKGDDINILKALRKEQTTLRLMQAEINVEEVVKDRSLKVFHEKCRFAYKPPSKKVPL